MVLEDKVRRIDEEISELHGKINTYGSIINDLHSRITELEKNDTVRQLEKEISTVRGRINTHSLVIRDLNSRMLKLEEKVKNPIYEKTIIQAIEKSTNEIVQALKSLRDEIIKLF